MDGSKCWLCCKRDAGRSSGYITSTCLTNIEHYYISNAGHHIYVDNFKSFNEHVVKAVLNHPLDPKEAFESPKEEIPDEKTEVIEDEIVKPRSATFSSFSK